MDIFKNWFTKCFFNFKNKKSVQFITKWKPIHIITCARKLKHHLLHGFSVRTTIWLNFLESSFKFKTKILVRLLGLIFFYFRLNTLLLDILCCFLWPWQYLFFILGCLAALCAPPEPSLQVWGCWARWRLGHQRNLHTWCGPSLSPLGRIPRTGTPGGSGYKPGVLNHHGHIGPGPHLCRAPL